MRPTDNKFFRFHSSHSVVPCEYLQSMYSEKMSGNAGPTEGLVLSKYLLYHIIYTVDLTCYISLSKHEPDRDSVPAKSVLVNLYRSDHRLFTSRQSCD